MKNLVLSIIGMCHLMIMAHSEQFGHMSVINLYNGGKKVWLEFLNNHHSVALGKTGAFLRISLPHEMDKWKS